MTRYFSLCLFFCVFSFSNLFAQTIQPPVAENLQAEVENDIHVGIWLKATDPQGLALTYEIVSQPQNGSVILSVSTKQAIYFPNSGFIGTDSFSYIAKNGHGSSNTAVVTINVIEPIDLSPVAEDLNIQVNQNTSVNIELIVTDPEGEEITYEYVSDPQHGTLTGTAPHLIYTPNPDFVGTDEFVFFANNESGWDAGMATVTIEVLPANTNEAPIADNQSIATNEGESLSIVLTANDVDGDALTYAVTAQPQNGTLSGTAPNLTYTPNTNFNGSDSFTFTANDGGVDSNVATIAITVNPLNDAPVADAQSVSVNEDESLSIVLTGSDVDGDALTYAVTAQPQNGTLSGTAPNLTYTPNTNFNGSDSFTFTANDGSVDSNVATIAIAVNPVNDAPVANLQTFSILNTETLSITLTGSDIDGDVLTYSIVAQPSSGTLSGTPPNITYTPQDDFVGTDTFTFIANDGVLDSAVANININLSAPNRPPQADIQTVNTPSNIAVAIQLTANDLDNNVLTYQVTQGPANGTLSGTAPDVTYTPNSGFTGTDTFKFIANDGFVDSNEATVTVEVEPENQPPVITSTPVISVNEDDAYFYDVEASDPDGDVLTYALAAAPSGMTIDSATGLIDWLTHPDYVESNQLLNTQCRLVSPDINSFEPKIKWEWTGSSILSTYDQVAMSPAIAQTNDDNNDGVINEDDIPDVIFISYINGQFNNGVLRILSGSDGTEILTIESTDYRLGSVSNLAVGDIDLDGLIEIIGVKSSGGLIAFNHDGSLLWQNNRESFPLTPNNWGAPAIADLDRDGTPEIIYAKTVVNNDGSIKWIGQGSFVARNHSNLDFNGSSSYAIDFIPEINGLEVIVGASVYDKDGNILWENTEVGDGLTAIANIAGDENPEMIHISRGIVSLLNNQGNVLWKLNNIPELGNGGPPTIADVDGDGLPEIGIAGLSIYIVLNHDGSILWQTPVQDISSSTTGSSVFDFNGDGRVEIVYADETTLRVYDGESGNVIFSTPNTSGTWREFPVIADIDNDKHADIVISANIHRANQVILNNGIRVFEDVNNQWVDTRKIWNQHAYSIHNVNDDGSIPQFPLNSWQTHNTFRLNSFPDRHSLDLADLTLSGLRAVRMSDGSYTINVDVKNRGLASTPDGIVVEFFTIDTNLIETLLGSIIINSLTSNEQQTLVLNNIPLGSLSGDILARVDTTQQVSECLENNNDVRVAHVLVKAEDPEGLSDTQSFTVGVSQINQAPIINSTEITTAESESVYQYQVTIIDSNLGDAANYELTNAPDGMRVNSLTGLISWTPGSMQVGDFSVTVRATDLSGASTEQTFTIRVSAKNQPPVITSAPVISVNEDDAYFYDVEATDPNINDVITYTFDNAPQSATIDSLSGVIQWTPLSNYTGYINLDNPYCAVSQLVTVNPNPFAEVIVVIDESGSMSGEHRWVGELIPLLDAHLRSNNIGDIQNKNTFGLVGFGDANIIPRQIDVGVAGHAFGSSDEFVDSTSNLKLNGGTEDGWAGLKFALNYPINNNTSKNMILITDEDRDNTDPSINFESIRTDLKEKNIILNVVVNATFQCGDGVTQALGMGQNNIGFVADGNGGFTFCDNVQVIDEEGTTEQDYIDLALELDGAAWNLNVLRNGGVDAQSFSNAFVNIKVNEIRSHFQSKFQPDLAITHLQHLDNEITVSIKNRGLVDINSPIIVNINDGGNNIFSFELPMLLVGQQENRTIYSVSDIQHNLSANATIQDQTITECNTVNNSLVIPTFTVSATDTSGLSDTQTFGINISNVNSTPSITSSAINQTSVNTIYSYPVIAQDPDIGDALEYKLVQAPPGMSIDQLTGLIHFVPNVNQSGDHTVSISVTDIGGLSDIQTFMLTVDNSYISPKFTSSPVIRAIQGSLYQYQTSIVADSSAVVEYRLFKGPEGLSIDTGTGMVSWQVPTGIKGDSFQVILQVHDQLGNYDIQSYTIVADISPSAPRIGHRALPIALQDKTFSFSKFSAAEDNEVDELTFSLIDAPSGFNVDAKTGVVLWDPVNTTNPGTIAGFDPNCVNSTGTLNNLKVSTKWLNSTDRMIQPLLGPLYDSNFDGALDENDRRFLVGISNARDITALDAITGKRVWKRTDLNPSTTIIGTLTNLDNDTSSEFVYVENTTNLLVALNSDGTIRWKSSVPIYDGNISFIQYNAIYPMDIDNDGDSELLIGSSVFDSNGDLLWSFPLANIAQQNAYAMPTVMDSNSDGFKEILFLDQVRDYQGNLLSEIDKVTPNSYVINSYFSYANFDADQELEIVMVMVENGSRVFLRLLDDDFSEIWHIRATTRGQVILGDFNNDGVNDIYLPSERTLYDKNGQVIWKNNLSTSPYFGATVADVDGDGQWDFLSYSPAGDGLEIVNAATGELSKKILNHGYIPVSQAVPIFVDVDSDGQGEIIATSRNHVNVFESISGSWLSASNNYSFIGQTLNSVDTNLFTENLSVNERTGFTSEKAINVISSDSLADLSISHIQAFPQTNRWRVLIEYANRGTQVVPAGSTIELYRNDSTLSENKIAEIVLPQLYPGEVKTDQTVTVSNFSNFGEKIFALIKPPLGIQECNVNNNLVSSEAIILQVTDIDNLTDTEFWGLAIKEDSEAPSVIDRTDLSIQFGDTLEHQIIATDNNTNDHVNYFIVNSSFSGATLNSETGVLKWTPEVMDIGSHSIVISASDLEGKSKQNRIFIHVTGSTINNAPVITSLPLTVTPVDFEYKYQVIANDPDGDALQYSLITSPNGMSINSLSGELIWQVYGSDIGSHQISILVTDERGETVQQDFILAVIGSIINNPPIITSTPTGSVLVDTQYSYDVNATDSDGDAITYLLTQSPAGMQVDSQSGEITWTPVVNQLGSHDIAIRVEDGQGGFSTQSFSINVYNTGTSPNNLPVITSTPNTITKANQNYQYRLVATDADGDTLSYQLVDAPTGMTISNDGLIEWTPTSEQTVPVTVRVADALGFVEQGWSLQVLSDTAVLSADLVVTPEFVNEGDTVSVTVTPMNAVAPFTVTATLDGNPIPLDSNFEAQITASGIGEHIVEATVVDQFESFVISDIFRVRDPNDPAPVVSIASPLTDSVITTPTPITVSVSDSNLTNWRLFRKEASSPPDEFVLLTEGTTNLTDDTIATLDPTLMLNGQYTLILQATDINGQISEDSVTVTLDGEMKVGHFSVSFEDLNIPMAGLPISIIRTYDTRRSHENLDFGFGWTVDYQNVRVHESRTPGFGWALNQFTSGPFGILVDFCVQAAGKNQVTVTLPDGEVLEFAAKASPECNQAVAVLDVNLVFEAVDSDNGATLEALDNNFGRLINGSLADPTNPGVPINPQRYKLTTAEGRELILDQGFTIREIKEPIGGNTLTFGEDGIIHSAGESVTFVRDAAGRITKVIAPDATELTYEYDVNGDLIAFTDQVGNRTTYTYLTNPNLPPHYLENIIDPRGIQVARNEYDNDGRLIATIDADGNRIEYTHDISGRVETIKDRNGNPTTYVYNDRGDVLSQTNAEGETTLHTYDAVGHELTRTNALGHTTTWTVDRLGNQLTETDPLGHVTTDTYGGFNQFETSTDEIGNLIISNFYLNKTVGGGALVSAGPLGDMTNALGHRVLLNYDSQTGELSRITDAEGQITINEYNSKGFQTAMIDAEGVRTDYVVDDMGRRLSETTTRTDSQGNLQTETTSFVYDAKGRLTQTTDAEGNITRTEYNGIDKESAVIDALGRRTEMEYDARGNLVLTRYPDGTTETMVYDAENNLIQETDRLGRVTKMVYDKANRLVETILPDNTPSDDTDNPRMSTEYDVAGRVIAEIDERNLRTEYGYDAADRVTLVRDALGQETQSEYDPRGLRTAMVDARGHRMQFIFDAKSRLVETIYPDITLKTLSTYDKVDRKIAETDMAGVETRYEYDKLGRLIKVIDALNQETSFTYDEQGNKLTQTDAEGRTTRWSYDNLGRVLTRTLPLSQVESFTYDAVGNMLTKTDFNGDVTTYTYDVNDRMVRIDYGKDNSFETFTYDAVGNRLSATSSQGSWTYVYDERNRLIEETKPSGEVLAYQYDANSNKTQLTIRYANGNIRTESMTYDVLNRLETVTDADGRITRYTYDAVGNRSQVEHSNGNKTDYVYDSLNRLTQIQEKRADDSVYQQFDYSLHPTGRRTQITELNGRTSSYTYDNLYRLTGESIVDSLNGDHTASYQYDKVGNRTFSTINGVSTAYTYDANDRLTQAGGEIYTYDAMGNTLTKSMDADLTTYTYNAKQQLTTAEITQGGTTTNASYQYNIDGIRNQKTDNGTVTHFLIDTNQQYAQVVAESDATQQIQVEYLFGDDLLSQKRNNSVFHYHYDGLGSTRLLSDTSGIVTDNYYYDAFGSLLAQFGSTENAYLYTGEQFDSTLDQYYLRARYYNQATGRFTQMDTWMGRNFDPVTLHKYLYANVDPVNMIDPTGNISLAGIGASLRINAERAVSATAAGKAIISRALTGAGKEAFGIIGEEIIALAKEALLNVLIQELAGPGFKNAGAKGTAAHKEFERLIENINEKYKKYGYTIHAEIFRDSSSKAEVRRRAKGSVGIDVEIRDRTGKAVLAFDLKTGRGTSRKKNRKLQAVFNADIIEIFVSKKK